MSKTNGSKSFFKTYGFLIFMISGIVAGCLVGAFAPDFGGKIKFLGTLFINMMFCVVVPMVFCSIASAIANSPGHFRRRDSRLVSYYALFQ